jgi:hypothetical protein
MFAPLAEQLDNVRRWNRERHWGLPDAELDLVDLVPSEHADPLVTDVVAVYLAGDGHLDGVRRTCHELWTLAAEQMPNSWSWDWYRDKWQHNPKPVRLLDGLTHRPGVRRVTVDLGAHWTYGRYIRPIRVRGKDSAHAEILAAAAHFPRWLRSMDGQSVPFTWLPGYQITIPERATYRHMPAMSWTGWRHTLSLTADHADHAHTGWSCPVIVS